MTVRVARHVLPEISSRGLELLQEDANESADDLEQAPHMFNVALNSNMTYMRARCALDPNAANLETWEAVVAAMQVGSALFASATATEETVTCRINDKLLTIPAVGPRSHSDAGNWLTAFWLAIVGRDQSRMTQLCRVPLEVLRASGADYDEYVYHWVDSLQTYWLEQPGLLEKLVAAIESSHPDVARIADHELLNKVLYQPINLFHRFLRKDRDGFNAALQEALELHREYWTADADREHSISGTIALGPLAITCLAYDADFPIEVESEYIPKHLITRSWVGEFPT
ncbi:immunity 49 family protein [Streptomyces sp. NPDC049555]|uniref:immunity 49 family protein n=1 Tax=Streptomyces sp. NPDC049555 TaxID=3154930 RepID=UPI0034166CCF